MNDGGSSESNASTSDQSDSSAAVGNSGVRNDLDTTIKEGQRTTIMNMEQGKELIARIINAPKTQQPAERWQAAVPASHRIDVACQLYVSAPR